MGKKTLKELLDDKGYLSCFHLASTTLVEKVEICGFVNSVPEQYMYREIMKGVALNPVVNKVSSNLIVVSGYIHQMIDALYSKDSHTYAFVSPIYTYLSKCGEFTEFNLEGLVIPSLCSNKLYLEIKKRVRNGVTVTESMVQKAKFPERFRIEAKNGKAMFGVEPGEILCKKDGIVKSVGEELLVLVRYIVPETGAMGYALYSLDEVFVNEAN